MQEAHAVDNDKYMQRVYVRDGPDRPIPSRNAVTLKTGLGVRQGHWKCHHVIECI